MTPRTAARREFLQSASAAAMLALLHPPQLFARQEASKSTPPAEPPPPLLAKIRMQSTLAIRELRSFYHERLGLPVRTESETEITFVAGKTDVTFERIKSDGPSPSYHFAFNIPENKIRRARAWQLERGKLIRTPEQLRDPAYPDDVRHFRNWNAHSVFFWDPAGNLVEYIARHEMKNAADGNFSASDILCASEFGMVIQADEQKGLVPDLADQFGLSEYTPEKGRYWTLGDANGLLLFLAAGPRDVDPDRAYEFKSFPAEAVLRGKRRAERKLSDYAHRIEMREE